MGEKRLPARFGAIPALLMPGGDVGCASLDDVSLKEA